MSDETELTMHRKRTPDFGLFSAPDLPPLVRTSDPGTSHDAATRITPKRGTQMATLLAVYTAYPQGLTDGEAERISGIKGSWKRSSDLRRTGAIRPTGAERDGQMVCVAQESPDA